MERRTFLLTLGAAALALRSGRALAATTVPAIANRLLLVFLRGGYDCANVLVPWSSSFYYESRPNIAVPKPDPTGAQAALELDANWALHPALKDSLLPFWQKGQLAFVPFSGTPDLSRSHFETQDAIEGGEPPEHGAREYGSGFMNRLAEVLGGAHPIAFTDGLPLAMTGPLMVPNVSLKQFGKPAFDDRQMAILKDMYRGSPLEPRVVEGLQLRKDVQKDLLREQGEAGRNAISAKGFELEARRMGMMMRERFNIGFIDVGGWDTHVNESAALTPNLENLGKGLAAFAAELGPAWSTTTVVVLSEFGRTFRENGTRGTDHGHGSVAWVLGGSVKGKRIAGEQVAVERATLFQDRDFPVLNDYRAVLGGLFRRLYGLGDEQLARVFPRAQPLDLGMI